MNLTGLEKYIPEQGMQFVERWLEDERFIIKITRKRKTKLGDYRFLKEMQLHQISVNFDLQPEAFFFVLTHEIAHLKVKRNHPSDVKSHGNEWKLTFGKLLSDSLAVYSDEMKPLIIKHLRNPKASVGADRTLYNKMFACNEDSELKIENLADGQKFRLGKRVFEKGAKQKIRYICREIKTNRLFLINGLAVADETIDE